MRGRRGLTKARECKGTSSVMETFCILLVAGVPWVNTLVKNALNKNTEKGIVFFCVNKVLE